MKTLLLVVVATLMICSSAYGQTTSFESFRQAVKTERAGFAGNKDNLSRIFNEERIRLAGDFETELWKYLGEDVEKHYWIGAFLESSSYLHGNRPLPELSLSIWQRGLELSKRETDEEARGQRFTMLVMASVLAQKLGKAEMASTFKNESIRMADGSLDVRAHFPGMSEFERCIYREIGGNVLRCGKEEDQKPTEKIVQRGHMKTPNGGDPRNYRMRVKVQVTIDEMGKVISATPVEGSAEYHDRAVALAKKAKFEPMRLSGTPVKVQGVLTYYLK